MTLLRSLIAWLFPPVPQTGAKVEERAQSPGPRLHVPRAVMHALRLATRPTAALPEPLVLLHVRFASEQQLDTIVAVAATPFPAHAYVEGFAGANFDTAWVVDAANAMILKNVGVFLVHAHGGTGAPRFSSVDEQTNRKVMAALAHGITTAPYGAMVLSLTSATAVLARAGALEVMRIVEVPDRLGRVEMTA